MKAHSRSRLACLGLFLLLAAGSIALPQPAPPADPPPAAFSISEHRPYPSVIKVGETLVYDPALEPKGIAGVGLTGDQVNTAINRGRDYLWPLLAKRASAPNWRPSQNDLLICLALLHCGAHTVYPELATICLEVIEHINPEALGNYEIPLVIMIAELLTNDFRGPGGAGLRDGLVRTLTQRVIDSQGPLGTFYYNWGRGAVPRFVDRREEPVAAVAGEVLKRTTAPVPPIDGDNSTTQYAAMALWRAARAGLRLDPSIWQRCRELMAAREAPEGGWAYVKTGKNQPPYGSMTLAGICTTALCRIHENAEPLDDPAVRRGLAWLENNWSVSENPGHKQHLYYYLYGLERAGGVLGIEFFGHYEWYPLGARFLVDAQLPAGNWYKQDREHDTSFALLFLTRATGRPARYGTLRTTPPAFVLLDERGVEVARGLMGESRTLPAGNYVLRVTIGDATFEKAVSIPEGGEVAVTPADLHR